MIGQEQPRWVTERAKCNLDSRFEVLTQIVERDVKDMNSLTSQQRQGDTFTFELCVGGTRPFILVQRVQGDGDPHNPLIYARFEKRMRSILIQTPTESLLVYPVWVGDRLQSCVLSANGDHIKEWELSQQVLGPLFFAELG